MKRAGKPVTLWAPRFLQSRQGHVRLALMSA